MLNENLNRVRQNASLSDVPGALRQKFSTSVTGDCKLAAPINLSGAPRPGNWTPFDLMSFPFFRK